MAGFVTAVNRSDDISEKNVEVLAIVLKSEAATWLAKHGKLESK